MALGNGRMLVTIAAAFLCLVAFYSYSQMLASWPPSFRIMQNQQLHTLQSQTPQGEQKPLLAGNHILHPEDHIHRPPTTLHFQWNITTGYHSPDGVRKRVYLINGELMGPTVEARTGDRLVIEVQNHLNTTIEGEGVSFHWHGMSMKGANEMDGVVGLTQCAIPPTQSATYDFTIADHQAGTFWYHAHSSLQRADGLFGGLIVHRPVGGTSKGDSDQHVYNYESEQLALIGDWYHRTAREIFDFYQFPGHFGLEPAPDSITINGQGRFDCSLAVKARPLNCSDVAKPTFDMRGQGRVRLRVINTGSIGGYALSLSQGSMRIITVDGGYPVSANTSSTSSIGVLHPGERMDLVITPSASASTSRHGFKRQITEELIIQLDTSNMPSANYALNPTQAFPVTWGQVSPAHTDARQNQEPSRAESAFLDLSAIHGVDIEATNHIHQPPAEKAVFYSALGIRPDNYNKPVGSINHTSWSPPQNSAILALPREQWHHAVKQPATSQGLVVPWFKAYGEDHWMEMTLNNFDERGHPFHMHGHEFFVVQQGVSNSFKGHNPFDEKAVAQAGPLNTRTPLRKDTIYLPPMGYAVLRFPLNNDGLWLLHCHVLWHQAAGMGLFFQVGSEIPSRARSKAADMCSPTR